MNVNVRIPDEVHEKLKKFKEKKKPHLSINSIIVEAILESLNEPRQTKISKEP